ncbi:peroxidase 60-like [Humulus lupulus]|uniref:peroxidase 60-like n=1 Tax=Humulus lupulus TaxID=3486 RepID=UPI002B417F5D|nr:peroxidase 60-like [Humulus lupulus]
MGLSGECYGALKTGFYSQKCVSTKTTRESSGSWTRTRTVTSSVDVEHTVRSAMAEAFNDDPSIVAALLRMHFHDCFVKGCDASILLDRNGDGGDTEKKAGANLSVRGYEVIDDIKSILETKCPRVVSCADIITMATRDAVFFSSGGEIEYGVETGRLDGKESRASNVILPSPTVSVSDSIKAFKQKGLGVNDMVYLLGGHTVGVAQCGFFEDRLYNFKGSSRPDPTMDPSLVRKLRFQCPRGSLSSAFLDQTPGSSMVMDESFYNQIMMNRGVLEIDQKLANDGQTRNIVSALATGLVDFRHKFGEAMVKMGRIGVITDATKGEIRRSCRATN